MQHRTESCPWLGKTRSHCDKWYRHRQTYRRRHRKTGLHVFSYANNPANLLKVKEEEMGSDKGEAMRREWTVKASTIKAHKCACTLMHVCTHLNTYSHTCIHMKILGEMLQFVQSICWLSFVKLLPCCLWLGWLPLAFHITLLNPCSVLSVLYPYLYHGGEDHRSFAHSHTDRYSSCFRIFPIVCVCLLVS